MEAGVGTEVSEAVSMALCWHREQKHHSAVIGGNTRWNQAFVYVLMRVRDMSVSV